MKKLIPFLIFNAVALFTFAQVTSVSYRIDKSTASSSISFDCKMIVNQGSASTFTERNQFASQYVIKVPTGSYFTFEESLMPLLENEWLGGTVPTEWLLQSSAIAPAEQPESDFYIYAPDIAEEASYNALDVGDEVTLFRIMVEGPCNLEVSPLDNGIDPTTINGIDFSQSFSIGSDDQIYLENQLPSDYEDDLDIYLESEEICPGSCATLAPILNCAPPNLLFSWSTGETTESIIVCPSATTEYQLTITGPQSLSLNYEATVFEQEIVIESENEGEGICVGDFVNFYALDGEWESSDTDVAIIDDEGELMAISEGTVTLSFISYFGCMAETTVDILPELVVSITGPTEICIGGMTQATPNVNTTWTSNNISVATVDNSGNITGVGAGAVTVNCVDLASGCSATSEMILVHADPFIQNIGSQELCVGEETTLASSGGGTWSSEDEAIATINSEGIVTAIGVGDVHFTFTSINTGCTGYSEVVIVHGTPDAAITGNDEICIGETTTLSPSTGGTWASADDAIATVTDAGLVTGGASGQTVFIFTNSTSGCSSESTDPVKVELFSNLYIVGPELICIGQDFSMTAVMVNGDAFLWTGPNGLTWSGPTLEIENATSDYIGEYSVQATTSYGCSVSESWSIESNVFACQYDFISTECSTAEVICDIDILDGLITEMAEIPSGGNQPNPLCDGQGITENISWIGFVAPEGDYELEIAPFNCSEQPNGFIGAQIGIYTSCDFSESVFCNPNCNVDPVYIPSFDLTPGEEYFLFIDGCEGSVCSYEISFIGQYISQCESPCTDTLTNNILGTAFIDDNGNGNYDSFESPLRNVLISNTPGDFSVLTDDNGNYSIEVEDGEYSLTANANMGEWEQNELTISGIQISEPCNEGYDFGFIPLSTPEETASISTVNTIARCDWETKFRITIENTGSEPLEGILVFEFDEEVTFFSSEISGYQVDGNTVTANVGPLAPFSPKEYIVTLKMPSGSSSLPLLDFKSSLFDKFGELIEEYEYSDQLRCSYDPNDKREYPNREGNENLTLMDENIEYTIRFQNNGNDTAFQVKIVDPIDPNIDPSSIRVISSSHNVETCIEGTDLIFTFADIFLVDSPTNYEASQGYVTFRCNAREGRAEMTPVHNQADIIFDTNAPIVTNQTINTLVSELCTDLFTFMEVSICDGDIYDGHTEPGVYTEVLELPFGCDSTVTLILNVQEITYAQENLQICQGSSITIDGQEYQLEENTIISDTTYNDEGCVSIVKAYDIEVISDLFDMPGEVDFCIGSEFSIEPNLEGTWTSNDESVIIINSIGNFIAVGPGSTALTFTENQQGCTDELTFSVYANPVVENIGSEQICINAITTLTSDMPGYWTSDDSSIATIDIDGEVTGVSEGTAIMTFSGDNTGCLSSISVDILPPSDPMCTVSTEEESLGNIVSLYPNPATTSIFIESLYNWESITVMDTQGKTISIVDNVVSGQTELDVTQLKSGLYMLIFQDGDRRESKRFVVSR